MFKQLTNQFSRLTDSLRGQGRLTEKNIADTIQTIRDSLLDADVALEVIDALIQDIQNQAVGQKVSQSLNPGQTFIKIFHDALVRILSDENEGLNFRSQPPVVILLAGLQGVGKTTTAGKLAKRISEQSNKRVLLASADVYRPAALEQLEVLAQSIKCDYFKHSQKHALDAAKSSLAEAKSGLYDVLILDTAGRSTLDDDMMAEIQGIHRATKPLETLFVVDSMLGQQAANIARSFCNHVPLTGVILTKTDGDHRGGAALSVKHIVQKPVKFIGTGEKIDQLDVFASDRFASSILGMGDMLSLIEDAKKMAQKFPTKKPGALGFNFNHFKEELLKIEESGGIKNLVKHLPRNLQNNANFHQSNQFKTYIDIINSMTKKERLNPTLLKGSQKIRIAKGSGTSVPLINQMMMQFKQMKMIQKKSKDKKQLMRMLSQRHNAI